MYGARLAAILALAAAVRLVCAGRTAAIFNDGPAFLELAQRLAAGRFAEACAHPYHLLYPLAIAAAKAVLGSWEGAAVGVSVVSGCAAVTALGVFLRDAFDRDVALLGAFVLAVHPFAVYFSSDVQSDGPYLALFLAGAALLWRAWRSGRTRLALAAGAVSGLAYLTRPEGLGVALVGAALGGGLVLGGRWKPRAGLAWCAALLAGAFVVMAPYLWMLHRVHGEWMLTQKKSVASFLATEPAREPPRSRGGAERPFLVAAPPPSAPGFWRRQWQAHDLVRKAAFSGFRHDLWVYLVVGIGALRGRPGPRGWFVLAFAALYFAVLHALALQAGYVSRRHALPPLTLTLGYVAVGIPLVAGWLLRPARRLSPRAAAPGWVTAFGLALVLAVALPKALKPRRLDKLAERRAAEWLRGRSEADGPVATRSPRGAYYAGAPYVLLPPMEGGRVLPYLRRRGARFVVLDEMYLGEYEELREPERFAVRVLHRSEAAGHRAAVFELPPSVRAE